MVFRLCDEQQKPALAGSKKFSAGRARFQSRFICFVDFRKTDVGEASLQHPRFVEQFTKARNRNSFGEPSCTFLGKFAHLAKDSLIVSRTLHLPFQDAIAVAFDAGVHKEHVLL